MRNNLVAIFFAFCLFSSCLKPKCDKKLIIGEWILSKRQINYPMLDFYSDSSAVFSSCGDTIYHYKYYVKNNSLFLIDINDKKTSFRIEKLDSTQLIFSNFIEHRTRQIYYKHK